MSGLPIITAEMRAKESRGITACIFGKSGIGKTSLLRTLPEDRTLFIDLEAGGLAVAGWQGDTIRPRTWQECRNLAAFIGGSNPALRDEQAYSHAHYLSVCKHYGDPAALNKYDTIFIDSITFLSRLCFQWSTGQSLNDRTGKVDMRASYGLHGHEMMACLTHLQHTPDKNIILVGILDEKQDEFGRRSYQPQLEGNKTALELPGIVDEVITMAEIKTESGKLTRAFICHTLNDFGYPAKDRSGHLNCIEEPHLGKVIQKIKSGAAVANTTEGSAFITADVSTTASSTDNNQLKHKE